MDSKRGILVIRLKSMGDVIFTLPAIHALRYSFPNSPLTFLVSKEYAALLEGFPQVAAKIELDRQRFRGLHPVRVLREALWLTRQMRRQRLTLAIDLQGYGETALLIWASGAASPWGTVYSVGRRWAYTSAVARNPSAHPAEDCLNLLRQNGVDTGPVRNEFTLPKAHADAAKEFFVNHGLRAERPTLFVQALTSAPHKNWPLSHYLEVAEHCKRQGWQVLFGGGPTDGQVLEPARGAGHAVATGVPLLVSAGLANLSTLVLGGDTGLVHLSVALGKQVIMILRSCQPGTTYPFQHRNWTVCARKEGRIDSIDAGLVKDRIDQVWKELRDKP